MNTENRVGINTLQQSLKESEMNARSIKRVMSMIALSLATSGCELIDDQLINDVIERVNDQADPANAEVDDPLPDGEVDELHRQRSKTYRIRLEPSFMVGFHLTRRTQMKTKLGIVL